MSARFWWVSWKEVDSLDDYRPVHCPPGPNVIAWWKSGEAGDGSYLTMVALVVAKSERDCEKAIKSDWPSKKRREWRFRNEMEKVELSDRFPFQPWSIDRLKKLAVEFDVEVA